MVHEGDMRVLVAAGQSPPCTWPEGTLVTLSASESGTAVERGNTTEAATPSIITVRKGARRHDLPQAQTRGRPA